MVKKIYKILLISFFALFIILLFGNNVYAVQNGGKEGAKGSYGKKIKYPLNVQQTGSIDDADDIVNFTFSAHSTRPIYVNDDIDIEIHARRGQWTGTIKCAGMPDDKTQLEEIVPLECKAEYDSVNEADIKLKLRVLKTGDAVYGMVLQDDYAIIVINVTITGVLPDPEEEIRKIAQNTGARLYEANVFETRPGHDAAKKAKGIIEDKYIYLTKDESTSDDYYKIREEPYYSCPEFDIKNCWKQSSSCVWEFELKGESTVLSGPEEGTVFEIAFKFWYLPDQKKILYTYYRERIRNANNEEVVDPTGQGTKENYENTVHEADQVLKIIVEHIMEFDYGAQRPTVDFDDVLEHITNYIPSESSKGTEELTNKVSIVLTVITNIGMILAVLMSAIMGVKYMLGSLEEKAEYKKDMIPYLIGACLLFGICAIVKVLQSVGTNINNI